MIISALQATTLEQQAAALNQEMNHCVTDWDIDDDTRLFPDLPTGDWDSSQPKKSLGLDDDLVELLWRNGQVVYSQTNRKSSFPSKDPKPVNTKPEQSVKSGFLGFITDISGLTNQNPIQEDATTCIDISGLTNQNLIQEDVTTSFLHYPLDDSLGNEFCSDFFYEMPISDPIGIEKPNKKFGENSVKIPSSEAATNKHRPERRPRSVFKQSNNSIDIEKPNNEVGGVNSVKIDTSEAATNKQGNERRPRSVFKQSNNLHFPENLIPKSQSLMPPPEGKISETIPQAPSPNLVRTVNFPHFSGPGMTPKTDLGSSSKPIGQNGPRKLLQVEVGESSMMTIGLSNCGSNQVENQSNLFSFSSNYGNTGISAEAVTETARNTTVQSDREETIEPTVTSSSGGSAVSAGRIAKQISMNQRNKRKGRDTDESEFQSEETEDESVEANKPAQRSASARRSRAAEVHNLSERRRRDRINEKMKALQELIPHSNKSDKASMLDEAIEYLKSLQLQVQIMWMGGGMFPVMFPGAQHYMPPLGVRPAPLPSVNGPSQLPGAPNRLPLCVPPALNPVNFQNQIRNSNFPEAYTRFLNFHHLQNSPQMVQQNHMATQSNGSSGSCIRGVLSKDIQCGKSG